jgi:hypothetical protein
VSFFYFQIVETVPLFESMVFSFKNIKYYSLFEGILFIVENFKCRNFHINRLEPFFMVKWANGESDGTNQK